MSGSTGIAEDWIEGNGTEFKPTHTTGTVQIPAELFERLCVAPKERKRSDPRLKFGNPMPVALGAFLMCTTALSMTLLGWQHSGGNGAAYRGALIFTGGVTQFLGAIGEWILGNTYPCVIFFLFGGFWISFSYVIDPTSAAVAAYSSDPLGAPAKGLENPAVFSTYAMYLISLTIIIGVFTVASVRTNFLFFITLLTLLPCSGCLTAGFFALGQGRMAHAAIYQKVGAGLLLAVSLLGWYIFISMILMAVDFPIPLPLGDLTKVIKGHSEIQATKKGDDAA